ILASVIVIPLTGFLGDLFGRKRYFVGSIVVFTASSFLCGASHSLAMLILWRVVQGVGGGALMTVSQAVLFESFPTEEAGMAMALFGLGVMVGPTIGPTLGGWLTDNYGWPWIFFINVPIGIVAAIMIAGYVKDPAHQKRPHSIDYMGIALLIASVSAVQYVLEHGERDDWFASGFITTLVVIGVVGGALLIWRELTTDEPVIDFRVLRSRQLTAGVSIAALLGVALYGSVFVLPIFLQSLHGMTAWQTGKIILPGALASAVTMGFVGKFANRIDARVTVTIGALLFMLSMYMLSVLTFDAGARDMFWPLIWRGVGLGLIFVPLTNATMADLTTAKLAQGTGMFNLTRQLGGSLGIAIMATLLTRFTTVQKSVLTEHIVAGAPDTQYRLGVLTQGLMARGATALTAHQQALALLDKQVQVQASLMSFSRIYLLSGFLLVASLPLLFLFKTGRGRGSFGVH
ncbi:MAG: DHA2 family efflux MFS transporter permease subunit, partial [Gemmatimonadaceae bacterium]